MLYEFLHVFKHWPSSSDIQHALEVRKPQQKSDVFGEVCNPNAESLEWYVTGTKSCLWQPQRMHIGAAAMFARNRLSWSSKAAGYAHVDKHGVTFLVDLI